MTRSLILPHHGLAGEIVRAILPHTEADPLAILVQLLTAFGAAVGRGPHFLVGGTAHEPRLFSVIVGKSAKARKDDPWVCIRRLLLASGAAPRILTSLSSGEGLIYQVRDETIKKRCIPGKAGQSGRYESVLEDEGESDKRLLVVESELAQVFQVLRRDGNTLSPVLRDAWDQGDLVIATKTASAKVTGAYLSIIGHITEDELRHELTSLHAANGFANRFCWLAVLRGKDLAVPEPLTDERLAPLARRFGQAVERVRQIGLMRRDALALETWHEVSEEAMKSKLGAKSSATLEDPQRRMDAAVERLAFLALHGSSGYCDPPPAKGVYHTSSVGGEDDEDDLPTEDTPWYEQRPACVVCGQPAASRNRRGEPVCAECWEDQPEVSYTLRQYARRGASIYRPRPAASAGEGRSAGLLTGLTPAFSTSGEGGGGRGRARGWDEDEEDEEDGPSSRAEETCWLCEDVVDQYDSSGTAWCAGCYWGWQDLLDALPPDWQRRDLAIWAAAAYHFARRPTLWLPSGYIGTGEYLQGEEVFRRLGRALVSDDPMVSREACDRLEWLVKARGYDLRR